MAISPGKFVWLQDEIEFAIEEDVHQPIKAHQREESPSEKRVDFAAIEKALDGDAVKTDLALRVPIRKVLNDLIELMKSQDKAGGITQGFVQSITLTTGPEAQKILGDYLLGIWRKGRELATGELPDKLKNKVRKFAGLEPVQAINFFQNLRPWLIKGIIDDELKKTARLELTEHLKDGRTLTETIGNLRSAWEPWVGDPAKVIPSGISGTPEDILQAYRIENIVRTEAITALSQGRAAIADEAGDFVVGFELSPILDVDTHLPLSETRGSLPCNRIRDLIDMDRPVRFKKDDPRSVKLLPPLMWNALPEGTRILTANSRKANEGMKWLPIEAVKTGQYVRTHRNRWRKVIETMKHETWPEEIVLQLDGGQSLAITDDHPILTTRGWIPAGDLVTLDEVICIAGPCKACGVFTQGIYCSRRCSAEGRTIHRYCQTCGSEIEARRWRGLAKKKPLKYCSYACAGKAKRKTSLSCRNCGKRLQSWTLGKSIQKTRRFCSFHCYHAFRGETVIENAVRLWLDEQNIKYTQHKQFGRYTVDFYVHGLHLAIEVDGEYWHGIGGKRPHIQQRRSRYLEKQALIIIRIPERAVKSGRFCNIILKAVKKYGKTNSLFTTSQDTEDRATLLQ